MPSSAYSKVTTWDARSLLVQDPAALGVVPRQVAVLTVTGRPRLRSACLDGPPVIPKRGFKVPVIQVELGSVAVEEGCGPVLLDGLPTDPRQRGQRSEYKKPATRPADVGIEQVRVAEWLTDDIA